MNINSLTKNAIMMYKELEPKALEFNSTGFFIGFSGGKDSVVIADLAKKSGVAHTLNYSITTVDPPELIYFMRRNYPELNWIRPKMSMWELIPHKLMPPTRLCRYCCDVLKEQHGKDFICVTGVRKSESYARSQRDMFEHVASSKRNKMTTDNLDVMLKAIDYKAQKIDSVEIPLGAVINNTTMLMNDNDERRMMVENCRRKGKFVFNPIIEWSEDEVWAYIKENKLPYCELYDQGSKRIGCIGCPVAGSNERIKQFERYPKIKDAYLRAFGRMIARLKENGCELKNGWDTPEGVMNWWLNN